MNAVEETGPERESADLLAAEYVLGVLPADERRIVAERIETDADFARLVERWEFDLSPMGDAYAPAEPPASVKAALDRRLFAADAAPSPKAARPGLWSSLAFWRGLAAAAVAALAIFIAAPYVAPPSGQQAERFVASLAPNESDVHYFVVYDARNQDVGLSHVTGARPEGRDFELWVIEGDNPPASLGVIPVGQSVHMAVADAIQAKIESGAVFAISLEPAGGSPTGQPTGPVVAAGDLKTI